MSTEASLLVGCLLHLMGSPPQRILRFFTCTIPGSLSLPQFQFVSGVLFKAEVPIPQPLLFEITQYTYLEKRVLVKKGLEIGQEVKRIANPSVLLHLYLLSLREDLSNENFQLIFSVLSYCSPSLAARVKRRGVPSADYRALWAELRKTASAADDPLEWEESGPGRKGITSDSASFFLDKYFSDEALSRASGPPEGLDSKQELKQKVVKTVRRARAPVLRSGAAVKQEAPVKTPRRAAHVKAGPPPVLHIQPPAVRSSPAGGQRSRRVSEGKGPRIPRGVLLGCAAFAVIALAVLFYLFLRPMPARTPALQHASASIVPSAQNQEKPQNQAEGLSYAVRAGDSLWKIYLSLKVEGLVQGSWFDFLNKVQKRNGIQDPNLIYPGSELSIGGGASGPLAPAPLPEKKVDKNE
jgi:hypothetical protein